MEILSRKMSQDLRIACSKCEAFLLYSHHSKEMEFRHQKSALAKQWWRHRFWLSDAFSTLRWCDRLPTLELRELAIMSPFRSWFW